jgi:hypothetical protein
LREDEERRKFRDILIPDGTDGVISYNAIQPNSESRDVTGHGKT